MPFAAYLDAVLPWAEDSDSGETSPHKASPQTASEIIHQTIGVTLTEQGGKLAALRALKTGADASGCLKSE